MNSHSFDLITIERVSMDLFATDIGADFTDITSFETGVGGSPTNIAIGASRLGLRTALLTAVGNDEVGNFVLSYLQRENVETIFVPRKQDRRTGMAVVGVQPPDKFPLVFYREDPADIYLTIDDVLDLPIAQSRALLLSGTALSRGTCRDVVLYAAEEAARHKLTSFIDLDLRIDQWSHRLAYGLNVRTILQQIDVIIGTEEEFCAALAEDPAQVMAGHAANEAQKAELDSVLENWVEKNTGPHVLIVKRGAQGVRVFERGKSAVDVAGFSVQILNTVGAGDAFASGLIFGHLQGWEWKRAARMANACGALVVTRHGCGSAMPTWEEVREFMAEREGSQMTTTGVE